MHDRLDPTRDQEKHFNPRRIENLEPSPSQDLTAELKQLFMEVQDLLEDHAELLQTEISEKSDQVKAAGAELLSGAMIVNLGLFALTVSAIGALTAFMTFTTASLVVSVALLIVGAGLLAAGGKNLKAKNLAPKRSLRSMRKTYNKLSNKVFNKGSNRDKNEERISA